MIYYLRGISFCYSTIFQNIIQVFPIRIGALLSTTKSTTSPEKMRFKIPIIVIIFVK